MRNDIDIYTLDTQGSLRCWMSLMNRKGNDRSLASLIYRHGSLLLFALTRNAKETWGCVSKRRERGRGKSYSSGESLYKQDNYRHQWYHSKPGRIALSRLGNGISISNKPNRYTRTMSRCFSNAVLSFALFPRWITRSHLTGQKTEGHHSKLHVGKNSIQWKKELPLQSCNLCGSHAGLPSNKIEWIGEIKTLPTILYADHPAFTRL